MRMDHPFLLRFLHPSLPHLVEPTVCTRSVQLRFSQAQDTARHIARVEGSTEHGDLWKEGGREVRKEGGKEGGRGSLWVDG